MTWTDPATEILDRAVYDRAVSHMKAARVVLPTFAELADPARIPGSLGAELQRTDPDAPAPVNLFRVHWYNDRAQAAPVPVPAYVELPPALTGVAARILVALGRHFPMIGAHKVL